MSLHDPTAEHRSAATERVATSKTKRYLVAAALLGGGMTLGAVFSPIGLAGAQSDDTDANDLDTDSTDTQDADAEETDGDDRDGRRGHRARAAGMEALTEILGLEPEDIRAQLTEGMTLAEIAEGQGIATEDLVAQLLASAAERVDEAVANGRIDAEEAEERLTEMEARITEFVTSERDGSHRHRHVHTHRHRHGHGLPGDPGEVLDSLGISAEELQAGFADGQTLADIAEGQGVSEEALAEALVAAATERVGEAVEAGQIDADQAEEITSSLEERIGEMIGRVPGERDGRPGHGHGHGHGHRHGAGLGEQGPGGDTDGAGETSETLATT